MSIRNYKVTCLECQHEWSTRCRRNTVYYGLGWSSTYYPCPKECPACNSKNIRFVKVIYNI